MSYRSFVNIVNIALLTNLSPQWYVKDKGGDIYIPLPLPLSCKQDKSSSFLVLRSPQIYPSSSAWHKIFRWMNEKWVLTNERTNAAAFCLWKRRYGIASFVREWCSSVGWTKNSCSQEPTNAAICAWKRHYGITSSVRPSVRPEGFLFGWMIEKWLLTSERTNERRILFVETLLRNHVVRPSVRECFSSVGWTTKCSGTNAAFCWRKRRCGIQSFCQGAFLFRWMNEKWMVRNERSILCAETTVRNHVVCVSGSAHWPPVKKKRRNSILFSRQKRFAAGSPQISSSQYPFPKHPSSSGFFFSHHSLTKRKKRRDCQLPFC